jgi:hypothetical protein
VSHIPGTIAEKYGPQTPGTNFGSRDTAIAQLDVPQMSARRERSPPSNPSPPACASMIETATAVPGASPISRAAASVNPPARSPIGRTRVPMRSKPTSSPIASKKSFFQPPSCPRYVHLHTVVQSERTSLPVAR